MAREYYPPATPGAAPAVFWIRCVAKYPIRCSKPRSTRVTMESWTGNTASPEKQMWISKSRAPTSEWPSTHRFTPSSPIAWRKRRQKNNPHALPIFRITATEITVNYNSHLPSTRWRRLRIHTIVFRKWNRQPPARHNYQGLRNDFNSHISFFPIWEFQINIFRFVTEMGLRYR